MLNVQSGPRTGKVSWRVDCYRNRGDRYYGCGCALCEVTDEATARRVFMAWSLQAGECISLSVTMGDGWYREVNCRGGVMEMVA